MAQEFDSILGSILNFKNKVVEEVAHQRSNSTRDNSAGLSGTPLSSTIQVASYLVVFERRIAEGGFGFIDLVTEFNTLRKYVLKRCNIQRGEGLQIANIEINLLQKFRSNNIVELLANAHNADNTEAYLLLQYCPNGNLLEKLNSRHGVAMQLGEICDIFHQILSAVKLLHSSSPSIIHRDLKLENILFDSDNHVRLCDFGSCVEGDVPLTDVSQRVAEEERIAKTTTQMYRAPEMVDLYMRTNLTVKTDIWALGCIFFAIVFHQHPFKDAGTLGILSGKYSLPTNMTVPRRDDIQKFIHRMLDVDPEARPTVDELLESVTALGSGAVMPEIPLNAAALECRAARMANETRRMVPVAAKKPPAPTAPRPPVALDPQSVAARRLKARNNSFDVVSTPIKSQTAFSSLDNPGQRSTSGDLLCGFGFEDSFSSSLNVSKNTTTSTSTSGISSDMFFIEDPLFATPFNTDNTSTSSAWSDVTQNTSDNTTLSSSLFDSDPFAQPLTSSKAASQSSFDIFSPSRPTPPSTSATTSNNFAEFDDFFVPNPPPTATATTPTIDIFGSTNLFPDNSSTSTTFISSFDTPQTNVSQSTQGFTGIAVRPLTDDSFSPFPSTSSSGVQVPPMSLSGGRAKIVQQTSTPSTTNDPFGDLFK
eukprot:gene3148-6189_t